MTAKEKMMSNNVFNKYELTENSFDFILHSLKDSIGNCESIKCLTDHDQDSTDLSFTQCWCQIMNNLIYASRSPAVGFSYFVYSSINSFHKVNVASCKTALAFTLLLWRQLKSNLIRADIPAKKLSQHLMAVLEQIIQLVANNKCVHLPKLIKSKSVSLYTRHAIKQNANYGFTSNPEFYRQLIDGACRHQAKIAALIWELLLKFDSLNQKFRFDQTLLLVAAKSKNNQYLNPNTFDRQEFGYFITQGIVLCLDSTQYSLAKELLSKSSGLKTLVVNASLTHDFTHLGFNKKLEFKEFVSSTSNCPISSPNERWLNQMKAILIDHDINLLIVKDKIDAQLFEFCHSMSILVINNLSFESCKNMMDSLDCSPLVYVEDFTEDLIVDCLLDLIEPDGLNNFYVSLRNANNFKQKEDEDTVLTVIVETRLSHMNELYKESLRHCMKRVDNILKSGIYLHGNGDLEEFLATSIMNNVKYPNEIDGDEWIYYDVVKEAFCSSFREFGSLTSANDSSPLCYDDFESKTAGWRTAVLINNFLLNTNFSISF